jgi:uncharacterized cupredoxin-like copper-binding protein
LKPFVSLTAGVLLALAIATCGGDDEKQSTEATQPNASVGQTVSVRETEFELDPANPRVEAGVVEFRVENEGEDVHALEVEAPGGEVETEDIQPGQSATLRADLSKPGRYEWYCPVGNHRDLGMEGEITVGGASSQAGTTTGTTETDTTTTETTTTETTTTETAPDDSGGSGSGGSGSGSGGSGY